MHLVSIRTRHRRQVSLNTVIVFPRIAWSRNTLKFCSSPLNGLPDAPGGQGGDLGVGPDLVALAVSLIMIKMFPMVQVSKLESSWQAPDTHFIGAIILNRNFLSQRFGTENFCSGRNLQAEKFCKTENFCQTENFCKTENFCNLDEKGLKHKNKFEEVTCCS